MRDPHLAGLPLILETPVPDPVQGMANAELRVCDKEIELLYRIQGIDDEAWEKEKDAIAAEWRQVRDGLNPPKEKKAGKGKGKKGKDAEEDEDEEDE